MTGLLLGAGVGMGFAAGADTATGMGADGIGVEADGIGAETGMGPGPGPDPANGPPTGTWVRYQAPVEGGVQVLRPFDGPPTPWAAGHRGVDLALAPDEAGVLAPADGTVTFAGFVVDRGVLTVLHPDGRRSSVEPVVAEVAVGAVVRAGERIARVEGVTHCTAPCVHWGVRLGEAYQDPMLLLRPGPVVLLPSDPFAVEQGVAQPQHGGGVHLGDA